MFAVAPRASSLLVTLAMVGGCDLTEVGTGTDVLAAIGDIPAMCGLTIGPPPAGWPDQGFHGDHDMETDYLPHLLTAEFGVTTNGPYRGQAPPVAAWMALSVAARSFAYNRARGPNSNNWASSTICNSTACQVYRTSSSPAPKDIHHQAVRATQGLVLVGGVGDIGINSVNSGYYRAGSYSCEERYQSGELGQNASACHAHAGKDFLEILRFFYGNDVQVVRTTGPCIDGLEAHGTVVSNEYPARLIGGQRATARARLINDGDLEWPAGSVLKKTSGIDSSFFDPDEWESTTVPFSLSAPVAPGTEIDIEFSIRAPDVLSATDYLEAFSLEVGDTVVAPDEVRWEISVDPEEPFDDGNVAVEGDGDSEGNNDGDDRGANLVAGCSAAGGSPSLWWLSVPALLRRRRKFKGRCAAP